MQSLLKKGVSKELEGVVKESFRGLRPRILLLAMCQSGFILDQKFSLHFKRSHSFSKLKLDRSVLGEGVLLRKPICAIQSLFHYILCLFHYIQSLFHYIQSLCHYIRSLFGCIQSLFHYIQSLFHYIQSLCHYIRSLFGCIQSLFHYIQNLFKMQTKSIWMHTKFNQNAHKINDIEMKFEMYPCFEWPNFNCKRKN